jgi:hypothetical protein
MSQGLHFRRKFCIVPFLRMLVQSLSGTFSQRGGNSSSVSNPRMRIDSIGCRQSSVKKLSALSWSEPDRGF